MEVTEIFVILAAFILGFGLLSGRLKSTIITPPMVFVGFGILLFGTNTLHIALNNEAVRILAELTLIMILFNDASQINLGRLRKQFHMPIRLLAIGMPLTIGLGTVAGVLLFPEFSIWEAAILAVILAPTDAALGQAVVSSPRVPIRIRQALNVESGLNDGIAVPVILIFISLASSVDGGQGLNYWVGFVGKQLILGPVVGIILGYLGGQLIQWGTKTEWMDDNFQRLSGVALALLSFSVAEVVGGNGFISAFVAGLVFGNTARSICHCVHEFMEAEGQLFALFTFMLFGLVMVPSAVTAITIPIIIYAILSLTLIRMIPVFISMSNMKLQLDTLAFVGWFGPRGIASVIFGLQVVEQEHLTHAEEIFSIAVITILISVFAHGVSAVPASEAYANKADSMKDEADSMPELLEVEPMM